MKHQKRKQTEAIIRVVEESNNTKKLYISFFLNFALNSFAFYFVIVLHLVLRLLVSLSIEYASI